MEEEGRRGQRRCTGRVQLHADLNLLLHLKMEKTRQVVLPQRHSPADLNFNLMSIKIPNLQNCRMYCAFKETNCRDDNGSRGLFK